MIEFHGVTKAYENSTALRNLSFLIEKGEMVFITGPSGAGKSTMLKLMYMAERPDEGRIVINGTEIETLGDSDIPYLRRNIGVVFQDFRLLPRKTAFDNVALALRIRGMGESDIKPLVNETLKMVNLRHKTDSLPAALSGGEQQRVVIARAIVSEPAIVLADEPTGNLDPDTSSGIMRILKEINARGTTIVIATHNRELLKDTGRRILRLDGGNLLERGD
ncbi:MAG: cell division ATP-binding protein FtsE [Thermodesulfovibrionales bacterium]|nr:cell division ATP-binding protein FtsE [Thermodesulfovibrionales bacterium]